MESGDQDENMLRFRINSFRDRRVSWQIEGTYYINRMEFQPFYLYYEVTKRGRRYLQLLDELENI